MQIQASRSCAKPREKEVEEEEEEDQKEEKEEGTHGKRKKKDRRGGRERHCMRQARASSTEMTEQLRAPRSWRWNERKGRVAAVALVRLGGMVGA